MRQPSDLIEILEEQGREIARLKAALARIPVLPVGFAWDVVRDTSGNAISTTETVELTATVPIPDDWGSYDLVAWLVVDIIESGTLGAARTVTIRLRRTDLAGADIGAQAPALDNANSGGGQVRNTIAVVGYSAAQTATGNQSVVFTSTIGADSGQASWDQAGLIVHAYRTS